MRRWLAASSEHLKSLPSEWLITDHLALSSSCIRLTYGSMSALSRSTANEKKRFFSKFYWTTKTQMMGSWGPGVPTFGSSSVTSKLHR